MTSMVRTLSQRRKGASAAIAGNEFAGPYESTFTQHEGKPYLNLLRHVNCSYLSSPTSREVTLEELKQHAHSLVVLISRLGVSSSARPVQAGKAGKGSSRFNTNEPFDWLNDLQAVYSNESLDHKKPLATLLNQRVDGLKPLEKDGDETENQEYCPMLRSKVKDRQRQRLLPLATHEAMAAHANDILERLDHDFSSEGGILSILPVNEEDQNKVLGLPENTLMGQWIAFTRALVLRCHDLERSYAHSLDVLAGEAMIPKATASTESALRASEKVTTENQSGFVICNVHENKWKWLEDRLCYKEAITSDVLNSVEVPTRYYRLKDSETIFVVPQWEGTLETQLLDQRPSVVQVVKPTWPERASAWEERNKEELVRLTALEADMWTLQQRNRELEDDLSLLAMQKTRWDAQRRIWALKDNDARKTLNDIAINREEQLSKDTEALDVRTKELDVREQAIVDMEIEAEKWIRLEKQKWRDANSGPRDAAK